MGKKKNKKLKKNKKSKIVVAMEETQKDLDDAISKSEKDLATANGEPWVNILSMDVDPEDLNSGAFELDWNDIFIAKLIKAGYQGKEDADLVDQWFQNVCRNVVLETYEQDQANNPEVNNPSRIHKKKDLGNGRSEIS